MTARLEDISLVVSYLLQLIANRDCVILLQGDLASGKTTLVREFVKHICNIENVTSPTFSIQSIYGDFIYHYDIYNKTLGEFIALGLLEEFEKKGIHFVEWGGEDLKTLLKEYGFLVFVVEINKLSDKREYKIEQA